MILVTTTPSVDGYTITNYQGIVFGEVVSGVNMFKDCIASMFVGRVRQCFSAVWADGFPRCRHRFPVM